MNVNDFHNSLGHANFKTLYEAAKQVGIKLNGIPFRYYRQAFQGEVPTLGGGCYYFFEAVVVHGVFTGSGTGSVGSSDIFTRRGFSRRETGGVSSSAWGGHSSHVFVWSGDYLGDIFPRREYSRRGSSVDYFGDIFPRRGYSRRGSSGDYFGDIFPRRGYSRRGSSGDYFGGCGDIFPRWGYSRRVSSGGGYRWHTRKRERSRTAGGSGCGAYATRIRPFRCSRNSHRRTFSDGAEAAGDVW